MTTASKASNRSEAFSFRDLVENKAFRIGGAAVIAIGSLALAGCAPNAGATEGPSTTPSVVPGSNGGETATPTPTPETNGSKLTVNYDRFADANWDTADDKEKVSACREFLNANDGATKSPEVALSTHSSGEEAEMWFNDGMQKIYVLMGDTSDPRNQDAAQKMLECMTVQHEPSNSAYEYYGAQLSGIASFGLEASPPTVLKSITVFSGEAFQATDNSGNTYAALGVQGIGSDLGSTPSYHLYELQADPVSGDNPIVRAAVVQPADKLDLPPETYFGPNIVNK